MEAINTRDIPGFYLNNTAQALSIREQVGSANLFLQYDIYHMQIMEGDLARTLQSHLGEINHVQLADNPGATNRAPVKSTTAFCSNTWTASGIRVGSVANTSR